MRTIEEQIAAMTSRWPEFLVKDVTADSAMWEGPLSPDKRTHVVRVRLRVPHVLENISLHNTQPRVQVIHPLLEPHSDYEEGPLPHVYWSDKEPTLPYLCLFSPELREWSQDDLIAATTVHWAAEWLYFYEGWLVTKCWKGGGRHPQRQDGEGKRLEPATV